jgi:hypothetical protein
MQQLPLPGPGPLPKQWKPRPRSSSLHEPAAPAAPPGSPRMQWLPRPCLRPKQWKPRARFPCCLYEPAASAAPPRAPRRWQRALLPYPRLRAKLSKLLQRSMSLREPAASAARSRRLKKWLLLLRRPWLMRKLHLRSSLSQMWPQRADVDAARRLRPWQRLRRHVLNCPRSRPLCRQSRLRQVAPSRDAHGWSRQTERTAPRPSQR